MTADSMQKLLYYPKGFPPTEEKGFGLLVAEYFPVNCGVGFKDPNTSPLLPKLPISCDLQ